MAGRGARGEDEAVEADALAATEADEAIGDLEAERVLVAVGGCVLVVFAVAVLVLAPWRRVVLGLVR